ncbi:MAG TPA: AI-2E family transporter [Gemmatimonadaceae bacterium]|nr:AI-2E family transporter [Gemmatimonadaceae bacterium]
MTEPTTPAGATPASPAAPPAHHPPVQPERRRRAVGWQSRDVLRVAALVIALYVAIRLLWFAHQLVFVVFLGVLFGLAVGSAVDRLERFRIRRGIAAALVVVGFLAVLGSFFAWMAPTLREQSRELRARLPQAMDKAESWVDTHQSGLIGLLLGRGGDDAPATASGRSPATPGDTARRDSGGARRDSTTAAPDSTTATKDDSTAKPGPVAPSAQLKQRIGAQIGGVTRYLFPFLSSTIAVFGGVLLIIFLATYIGAEPRLYRTGLMHLFPRQARRRADEVLGAMAVALRKWLVTQLIAMVAIGLVTTIALLVLRVKAAVALGILAGLFEFIPTVGPILSAVPAVAMGFVDSPEKALAVALVYVAIQFLENHILIPLLMRGGVDLPPALTVVSQALMALIFGFIGLMVAVPLLAAVMVPIKMLYVEGVIGDRVEVLENDDDADDSDTG